jgi:hypothetical protein
LRDLQRSGDAVGPPYLAASFFLSMSATSPIGTNTTALHAVERAVFESHQRGVPIH